MTETAPQKEQAYGHNGTIEDIIDGQNKFGDFKVVLLKKEDGKTIPGHLYGKLLTSFKDGHYKTGDALRIYGPYKGIHTVTTEKGIFDVQAVRVTWIGTPDPSKKGTSKNSAKGPEPFTAKLPTAEEEPWGNFDDDDDIKF